MTDEPTKNSPKKPSMAVQLARYSQLGFALPACTMIGLFIGKALDYWLGTRSLSLVGLLLGIAAGFMEIIRAVSRLSK